jgi:hypothetical protein
VIDKRIGKVRKARLRFSSKTQCGEGCEDREGGIVTMEAEIEKS